MPKYTDPFWLIGTGMQLILLFYVVYIAIKLHRYFKNSRKYTLDPQVAAWSRVVMDPHATRRPNQQLIDRVARGVADTQGEKRISPWVQRGIAVAAVVIVVVLLFNLGFFTALTEERQPPIATLVILPYGQTHVNDSSVCGGAPITRLIGTEFQTGVSVIVNLDGWYQFNETWHEIKLQQSPRCQLGYYTVLSSRELSRGAQAVYVAPTEEIEA